MSETAAPSTQPALRRVVRACGPGYLLVLAALFVAAGLGVRAARAAIIPAGAVDTGILSRDEANYAALSGSYREGSSCLSYRNPFAPELEARPVLSQLLIIVLAWATSLTGSHAAAMVLLLILGGVAMLLLLHRLLEACELPPGWTTWLFLGVCLGGGCGWLLAGGAWGLDALARAVGGTNLLAPWLVDDLPELAGRATLAEHAHGFERYWLFFEYPHFRWRMTVFQVFFLATDLLPHALFFASVLAVLRERLAWALVGLFLAFWAHPFTGIHLTGALGLFALLELWRGERPAALKLGLGAGLVGALGVGYYLLLGRIPDGIPMSHADTLLFHRMQPRGALATFGPPLALVAWGLGRAGPRALVATRPLRLAAGWALAGILLVWVQPLITVRYQPLHYARGFLWTSLTLLGALLLAQAAGGAPARPGRRARLVGVLLLGALALDNLIFLKLFLEEPWDRSFVLTPAQAELVERLQELPEPELVLTVPEGTRVDLGKAVVVLTHHHACLGDLWWTWDYDGRRERLREFARHPTPELPDAWGATLLVLPEAVWEQMNRPPALFRTARYCVVRWTGSD